MPFKHFFFKPLVFSFAWLSLQAFPIQAQVAEVKGQFGPPLEIPLYLAGNFAELRSNHFHSGIDIKTQGREGLKVIAVADGYVSRIKVSPFGYGNVIYVRHPNGYTSVYAHLQKFNDEIAKAVREYQYRSRSFKVEMYPSAGRFPIKKGDIIAISGNSGSSAAPHLHFEIRESASEAPMNPLLFGFDIADDIAPEIDALYIYPMEKAARVNGRFAKQKVILVKKDSVYRCPASMNIRAKGRVGIGLDVFDQLNEMPNHCGIYEIEVYRGKELIFHQRMDRFSFNETRYLNALVDYEEHIKHDKWINRAFILPNNRLSVYTDRTGDGTFIVKDGRMEEFTVQVRDAYGNTSILKFEITGSREGGISDEVIGQKPAQFFTFDQANSFERDDIMLYLPANILYEDLNFLYWKEDTLERAFAPLYHIHDWYTPLQSYMALSIRLKEMPASLRKYALVVSLDNEGGILPEGGYWKGDYLIVKTRSFGPYTVMIDSVKPRLTPINIPANGDMSRKWSIMIKAEDNLSGVDKYDAYIDGNWALMEFDYKKKRLIHHFEDELAKGPHTFKLVVKDERGNESTYSTNFSR